MINKKLLYGVLAVIVLAIIGIALFMFGDRGIVDRVIVDGIPWQYPLQCDLTYLEFEPSSEPCIEGNCTADCTDRQGTKEEGFTYTPYNLKNQDKFIAAVENTNELQDFLANSNVTILRSSVSYFMESTVRVFFEFKIQTEKRWYATDDVFYNYNVKDNKIELAYEGMQLSDILKAIELAENDEKVKKWNEKFPHEYGDNIYFTQNFSQNSIDVVYQYFVTPSETETFSYGIIYSYDFVTDKGAVTKISPPPGVEI